MSSLKDILRSITTFVNSSNSDVQSIIDLIDNFATPQDREKTDKISAELLNLFNSIQNDSRKFYSFLKCLRALLPILGADIFITDWWSRVLLPVLQSPLQPRDIVEEVKGITRDLLVFETERVAVFRKEIIELYLKESSMVGKAAGEGKGIVGEQRDTSTTLISLLLTTLTMLLPHICTSVASHLPRLYTVFIRILCWDKRNLRPVDYGDEVDDEIFDNNHSPKEKNDDVWEQCDSTFDNIPSTPPNCLQLFTILYGMFPCNTIEFLRDPTAWLKEKDYAPPLHMKIDDDVIRTRSVPLLRRHTLHPNIILSDSQKELSDTSRWMKLEPADVVAECVGLDMENASTSKPRYGELDDITVNVPNQVTLEAETGRVRRTSQSISLREIMDVHQALKSGADIVVGDDPWTSQIISYANLSTSQPPVPPSPNSSSSSTRYFDKLQPSVSPSNVQASISFLQREIMLLRNELNFELYLKQQHLQHISRLHRDHVLDNRVEAESQNLYNTCRNLKIQLEKTQTALNRQRDETLNIKKKHVQWEDDLNAKLKKYREEKKGWKTEIDKEADTRKFQEQKQLMETLVAQWHKMKIKLESGEAEIKKLKLFVSSQSRIIDDLKAKSESSLKNTEKNALEKQMRIWTLERDRRDKEFKKLETYYENVKKRNEELQTHIIDLLAQIESLTQSRRNSVADEQSENQI
ncbi:5471_t:CDS:2 [Acaulospora colombiana]|uniref:5471_t:CDS:1 n=1 Tax=Acaulospora colombiana TaxID=27376 RepID=A0ACA9JZH8_9GLOM|nr:5471_t:CDS:2 [Acaulospora colombiana]